MFCQQYKESYTSLERQDSREINFFCELSLSFSCEELELFLKKILVYLAAYFCILFLYVEQISAQQ